MAKRLSESEKWKDQWFLALSPQSKLLWEYIRDNCDLTGMYEINVELTRFQTKFSEKVDIMKHLREFNEVARKLKMSNRVEFSSDEKYLWIVNFVKIQYGFLKESVSTHRGVLKVLNNNLLKKGLPKGYQTLKDKAQNKDTLEKGVKGKKPFSPFPEFDEVFRVFKQQGGTKEMAEKFFNTHSATDWKIKGQPISNFVYLVADYITIWRKFDVGNLNGNSIKGELTGKPIDEVLKQFMQ